MTLLLVTVVEIIVLSFLLGYVLSHIFDDPGEDDEK